MSDGFAVDPAALRSVAPRFAAEGDRLAQALTVLQGRLDALGAPWGDDAQGRAWAARYEESRPKLEHAMAVLADALRGVDACLVATADNHDACERANTIARA